MIVLPRCSSANLNPSQTKTKGIATDGASGPGIFTAETGRAQRGEEAKG